jgi:hypothetical protein
MNATPPLKRSSHRRREGRLVAVVSAAFVLLGVALGDRVPWYATAFFALCLIAGVLSMLGVRPRDRAPADHLAIDDAGITRTAPGLREHVTWTDIARVRILTNDRGPWLEDVFFVIDSRDGSGCVVTHDLAMRSGLLDALYARLEGLNSAAVIAAMVSAENRVFTIWEAKGSA